ncbi:hypothetical protein HWV62_25997 [Athelia sp. TMB]|nr:hypothetical protein HWV62_25997 [Athelia sp. TMB]
MLIREEELGPGPDDLKAKSTFPLEMDMVVELFEQDAYPLEDEISDFDYDTNSDGQSDVDMLSLGYPSAVVKYVAGEDGTVTDALETAVVEAPGPGPGLIKELDVCSRAAWTFEEIKVAEANIYLDDARYHGWILRQIEPPAAREGYVSVQLLILIKWRRQKERRMNVTFMAWGEFKDIMISDSASRLRNLARQYDCLLGGADLSQDIMTAEHELTSVKHVRTYLCNIQSLSWAIAMWPPVQESLYSKRKYELIKDLDEIARKSTATCRPVTRLITSDLPHPLSSNENPNVVKREESNACKNIHFPEVVEKLDEKEIIDMYPRDGRPRWMLQSYVPYVTRVGEWRMFMRGGRMMQGVITTPQEGRGKNCEADVKWSWTMVVGQYSLREMHEIMTHNPDYISDDVSLREGGRLDELHTAKLELTQFTETTLKALIFAEKAKLSARFSSLELFCQLDMSIIDNGKGGLHYWVNEVERGPYAALYGNKHPFYPIGRLADELARDIPNWIDGLCVDLCSS